MADQTKLLKLLADRAAYRTLDVICDMFQPGAPNGPKTKLRKEVINALGKLLQKKLVERLTPPRASFGGNAAVEYRCTDAGLALVAADRPVTGGKSGPRANLPKPKADMRQRLWEALRIAKKSTARELVELVRAEGDSPAVKVIKDCRDYFALLARAGIITKMANRAAGYAPTSNGFARYALIRDLGPIAPSAGKRFVTDHNARVRIDYRQETP